MPALTGRELKHMVQRRGANVVADHLIESMRDGTIPYNDMPSIRDLYEALHVRPSKEPCGGTEFVGQDLLNAGSISLIESAAEVTDASSFNFVSGQLFFNALTTRYRSADKTFAPLCRVIPSTVVRGDVFAGVTNLTSALQPVTPGEDFPTVSPSQDYSQGPPQLQRGALVGLTWDIVRGDRTGEIMSVFENLGDAMAATRELEAVGTLVDVDATTLLGVTPSPINVTRNRHNWKGTKYATYQGSTPWVNDIGSNELISIDKIATAWVALRNQRDPFTGAPLSWPEGRLKLIVTPELYTKALQLKATMQHRTGTSSTSDTIQIDPGILPVEFDVVESQWLGYYCDQTSQPKTTWYFGNPNMAFSCQQMLDVTMAEAVPNTGKLFTANLAAMYRVCDWKTFYAFQPRAIIRNRVAA